MPEQTTSISFNEILRVFMKYRRVCLLCAALFCIIALQVAQRVMPKKYTSSAVFERRSDVATQQTNDKSSESFDTIKKTLPQDFITQSAMEQLVDELEADGLIKPLEREYDTGQLTNKGRRERQQLIDNMKKNISIEFEVRSQNVDYVIVAYKATDPLLAAKVPNELIKIYINNISQSIRTRLQDSLDYLISRKQQAEKDYSIINEKRGDFEQKNVGITMGTPIVILQHIQETKAKKAALESQLMLAQKEYAKLMKAREESDSNNSPSQVIYGPNPELAQMDKDLQNYRNQLETARVLDHMTDEHPVVKSLQASIKMMEDRIKRTPAEIVVQKIYSQGVGLQSFAAMAAGKQEEIEQIKANLTLATTQLKGFEAAQESYVEGKKIYGQLMEDWQSKRNDYDYWDRQVKNVKDILAAEVSKRRTLLSEINRAEVPLGPSSPNILMIFAFAFVGGIAFGMAVIFLLYKLDRTVSTPEEAARIFNLPVYGVISEIIPPSVKARRKFSTWLIEPAVALVLLAAIAVSTYSTVLWLQEPDEYARWNSSPIEFIQHKIEKTMN
ncbi:MAG TPA: hypothetical protein PKK48_08815 [Phycisphaerae bacterium]|nr:hypothetical protein [Phycisphaerae bacterium]HPS53577.1 hypothetical protein [Phycisphaerae bacterium]